VKIPFQQINTLGRTYINLTSEVTAAVIRTVEAGWEIARTCAEVTTNANEVAITECLRDCMRIALVRKQMPWRRTMIILPGTESRSQSGMSRPDGRTDIPLVLIEIFLRYGEHDPHAIIESKRLAINDTRLAREYVVEGIDRFRNGKYAANHNKGFMLGYIVNGNPMEIVQQINAHILSLDRATEQLQPSIIIPSANNWFSDHPRVSGSPIELHHAMLPLSAA
jgi:hypothetical protein